MKDYRSSIDKDLLRRNKHETTAEQRMNWLQAAAELVKESRKHWKKPVPGVSVQKCGTKCKGGDVF